MTKLYQKLLKPEFSSEEMKKGLERAKKIPGEKERNAILSSVFSMIDLTSLNATDSSGQIKTFTEKAAAFNQYYPNMSNVAAVCVFPNFVVPALEGLGKSGVKLAVVSASFPTSQTFLEVKMLETEIAVRNGADEIDIVIPLGMFLERDYDAVIEEIKSLRQVAGEATLKVIIESGLLGDKEKIYRASVIAMESGADFIKTSTGKSPVSATPEAAWIMCRAIHDYREETGIMIGFKPAGGIVATDDAIVYYNIVRDVLGENWLSPEYFRIGASRLANNILKEIYPERPAYF
ncbi:MAG: deoxyribose-phosphate aldolase [Bacteroidales bacterium]|nr:deoxyribose-phosphate aldolase [Bacteroidales bacterium]